MRRSELLYVVSLGLVAAASLAFHTGAMHYSDWSLILSLSLMIAASGFLRFIDLVGAGLSFVGGAVILALLVGGLPVALWSLAIGTLVESLLRSGSLAYLALNVSGLTVALTVAGNLYVLMGGGSGSDLGSPVPAIVASAAYMLANALIYAFHVKVRGVLGFAVTLRTILAPSSVRAYMITMLLGILTGYSYVSGGLAWALVVLGSAYMIHSTLRLYFETVREARSQTQQLEAVLNATHGALVMTDPDGTVRVANRQAGVLFDIQPDELVGKPSTVIPELQSEGVASEQDSQARVIEILRGPARYLHWYRARVLDPEGQLQGHIQVFTDITPLKRAEQNLRQLNNSIITALSAAIDARDSYTHGHSSRVSQYSVALARSLGLGERDVERIRVAALLHDLGKLGVADAVLTKNGPLTPRERSLMMQHPVIGAEVLQKADVLTDLIPGVRWHHEWISGGGYPDGLAGEQIPLDARIICVADAFDAMTSDRQYRKALPVSEALNRVGLAAGVQFDHRVAAALAGLVNGGQLVVEDRSVLDHALPS